MSDKAPPDGGTPRALRRSPLGKARSLIGRIVRRFLAKRKTDPGALIVSALHHAGSRERSALCIAASFPLNAAEIGTLSRNPAIKAVVSKLSPADLPALQRELPDISLGAYWEPGRWILPDQSAHIYFVGSWRRLTLNMLREALRQRASSLTAMLGPHRWIDIPLRPFYRLAAIRRRLRHGPRQLLRWRPRFREHDTQALIASALADARSRGRSAICVATAFPLSPAEIGALDQDPAVQAVVSKLSPADLPALQQELPDISLGAYWEPGRWILPDQSAHIYFVGSWRRLTLPMMREVLRLRPGGLTALRGSRWVDIPLPLLWRLAAYRNSLWRSAGPLRPLMLSLARLAGSGDASLIGPPLDLATVAGMLDAVRDGPPLDFVPGRIVVLCGNLSPGGAERQVAYTASGVAARSGVESVRVLCDRLTANHPERYDFYLPFLEHRGIETRSPERAVLDREMIDEPAALASAPPNFPEGLLLDVANLYRELVRLRPEIVHAWLDWSNTRGGLAAALAGVPKILLSGRNLNPTNFALYQPYMDPVYQALCDLPNVVMLNNSRAGAESYAEWLGIEPRQIKVVYNGFDPGTHPDVDAAEIKAKLGIPQAAPLVGGVFRFYPEKRPLLWIEVAAHIARLRPDAWFVLYGQGVLKPEMETAARAQGLADRLVMAGVTDNVLPAMRAMDVFLLTSFGEGLPNVVLEAQWMGTPVVATQAGGVVEALEPGKTGWIVDPPDPKRLAERVVWLLDHPGARLSVQDAGPELIRTRFGVEHMIDETIRVYGLDGAEQQSKAEPATVQK